jgi:hypothetical protein
MGSKGITSWTEAHDISLVKPLSLKFSDLIVVRFSVHLHQSPGASFGFY